MNEAGVETGWRIMRGTPDFFTVTKQLHNALQGSSIDFSETQKEIYLKYNKDFAIYTHISNYDAIIIHDPQPLPLIKYYKKNHPWIWRCHVDLSNPDLDTWEFLKQFIVNYDQIIISNKKYIREDLPMKQKIIQPAIDPLSLKNIVLNETEIVKCLLDFEVSIDKPLITQVSRFDKWKDPQGVISVFKKVKDEVDCRLVLCGNIAADDPGGLLIRENVMQKSSDLIEKGDLIFITCENNILVNALQRFSTVIIQKSIKEGFGLTVTEALWKEKPVVASKVGGIQLQIDDGKSGFLVDPNDLDSFAERIIQILKDPELAKKFGKNGQEKVRKKFLITRLILDYFDLLDDLLN